MTPLGRRLYRLSLASGLFLAAPLLFGTAWYAWSAYATLDRYRRAFDPKQKIDLELFQIALHDELTTDLRRLSQHERPAQGLPTFALSLSRGNLDALENPRGKNEARYVKALLEKDGRVHEVEVRYRGDQPWHTLADQKSIKVHLKKGDLIDGVRVFNLLNDPTPFGLEDQIILDVAREEGLLTPEYHPIWLRFNNHDLGVYRFEAQPDETLIRRGRRTPGNMYSGDSDQLEESLFASTKGWQKIASRLAGGDEQHELDRLIHAVSRSSHASFARYVDEALDLERFAQFDALDVVFGGSEHDWFSNWKLYSDPYRGKIEPVAWSFRGFQHEDAFNVIDPPPIIRLKMTPGYLPLRDRKVYELLTGKASVPAIRERADRAMIPLAPELVADPYWDAYKQLPRASRFHRFYLRPMTIDAWLLAAAYELDVFGGRTRYLLDQLEDPGLEVHRDGTRIDLVLAGHAAYRLMSVRAEAACQGELEVHADVDLDGVFDPRRDATIASVAFGESAPVTSYRDLQARAVLVPHPDPKPKRGLVRAETEPTLYTFFLSSTGCSDFQAALLLENVVVRSSLRIDLVGPSSRGSVATSSVSPDRVPRFVAGERAPHPWSFEAPTLPAHVALGPGRVVFDETRTFLGEVDIAPGTTIALGKEASLVFRGRVLAHGTPGRPIAFVRADPGAAFGGIALQGPGTAGSRFTEIRMTGGSRVRSETIDYSALINVHDTRDVAIDHATLEDDTESGDVVHANTVRDLALSEITIKAAPVDAIDLEFVEADVRGLALFGAGDDCFDLMGSSVRIQDSVITGCINNAISAGEESDVTINRSVIARSKTGVLSKNGSEVRLLRSLLYQNERALRARRKQIRYGGISRIGTSDVFVVGSEVVHDFDKSSVIELAIVRDEVPEGGDLDQVREQVLRIPDWSQLDTFLGGGSR